MASFPLALKPSITQGYGLGAPDNIISQQVQGGAPLRMLDYRTGPVTFNVGFVVDPFKRQIFYDFYYGKIDSGSAKFTMNLDSGNGIEEHNVFIAPGSFNDTGDRAPIWTISFTIIAETTPFQENPFMGELVDLSDLYDGNTKELLSVLNQLEIYALEDLPYDP